MNINRTVGILLFFFSGLSLQAEVLYQNDFNGKAASASTVTPEKVPSGFVQYSNHAVLDGAGHLVSDSAELSIANYRFRLNRAAITEDVTLTAVIKTPAVPDCWVGVGFQGENRNGLTDLEGNSGPWMLFASNYAALRGGSSVKGGVQIFKGSVMGYRAGDVITVVLSYHPASKTADLSVNGTSLIEGFALDHEFPAGTSSDPVVQWMNLQFFKCSSDAYVDSLQVETAGAGAPSAGEGK